MFARAILGEAVKDLARVSRKSPVHTRNEDGVPNAE